MRIPNLFRRLFRSPPRQPRHRARHRVASSRLRLEALEERMDLSTFTPNQVSHAYGFDRVGFLDSTNTLVPGDGRNTTIAIVMFNDDPNIAADLATFDSTYGIVAPPSFTKVNQRGGTTPPAPNSGWAVEIALDVEYAHAMAPAANILLVAAASNSFANSKHTVERDPSSTTQISSG